MNEENKKQNVNTNTNTNDNAKLEAQKALLAKMAVSNAKQEDEQITIDDWRGYNVEGEITQIVVKEDGSYQVRANYYDTDIDEDMVGTIRVRSDKSEAQHKAMVGKRVKFTGINGIHNPGKTDFDPEIVNYSATGFEIIGEAKNVGGNGMWNTNQFTTGRLTRIKTVVPEKGGKPQQARAYVLLTMTYDTDEVKDMLMKFKCSLADNPSFAMVNETLIGATLDFNGLAKNFAGDWTCSTLPTMSER